MGDEGRGGGAGIQCGKPKLLLRREVERGYLSLWTRPIHDAIGDR